MYLRHIFITTPLYPAFCFTLALILGIWWQSIHHTFLFYIFLVALCVAALSLIKQVYACSPIFIALYSTAFLLGGFIYSRSITNQTEFCNTTHNKKYTITVTINSIKKAQKTYMGYSCICTLKSMQAEDSSVFYPRHIQLLIYIPSIKNVRVQDTLLIQNVYFKTPKNKNFLVYLLKEHVATSVSVCTCPVKVIHRPRYSIKRTIAEYMNTLNAAFYSTLTKETYCAFSSIFLGDPQAKKREGALKKQLNYWGVIHYIARSGLHLLIFVSIWMFILNCIPLPWVVRQLCILVMALLYNLLSWPSVAFSRALYSLILVKTAGIFTIKTYFIPTLACITCMTLILNPVILFSLDFQLSFGITYALAWFNEIQTQSSLNHSTIA